MINQTRQTVRFGWRWSVTAIIVIVLLALAVLGLWRAHWWFFAQNTQRSYNVLTHSQQYQTSLTQEMDQHLANIAATATTRTTVPAGSGEQATLRAQQLSEIRLLCTESQTFYPQPGSPSAQQLETTVQANCLAGAPVASPPLANPVPTGGQ